MLAMTQRTATGYYGRRVMRSRLTALAAPLALGSIAHTLWSAGDRGGIAADVLASVDDVAIVAGAAALSFVGFSVRRGEGALPSWWRRVWPLLWRTYVIWWTALAMSIAAGNEIVSPTRLFAHAVLFRHPGGPGAPPDLAAGTVLAVLAPVALVLPLVDRLLARRPDRELAAVMALIVAGAAAHLALTSGSSVLSDHVLGRLHLVGLGLLAARVLSTYPPRRSRAAVDIASRLGPAMFILAGPALGVVARQYRELIDVARENWTLDGQLIAPFIWSSLLACALAVTLRVLVETPLAALLDDRPVWPLERWTRSWNWWLAGITGGAFVWRVVTLLTIAPERTDGGDPLFYHATANLIAQGRGFPEPLQWIAYAKEIPSALHGPLYPVYLSIWSRLGATTYFDQKMASILVGTATVVVAGLLGRRVAGRGAGLAAAGLAAVYPHLWLIDGVMFPEGLFVLLCGVAMLSAYRWRDTHSPSAAVVLGASIGAAALTRGEGLFLAVLLVMPWMLRDRLVSIGRRWRDLVVAGAACVAVLAPWTIFNVPRFEVFVPLSTNGNELHVYSNCDDVYSGKFIGFWSFECQERIRRVQGDPPGDEAEKAVAWREVGFDYARDNADQLPKVVAARVLRQWDLLRPLDNARFAAIEGRDVASAQVGLAMYAAMVPLAVLGVRRVRRRGVPVWPLLSQVAMVTITAAYAYGTTRFRAPAELSLCVLAGVGLAPLIGALWRRLAPRDDIVSDVECRQGFVVGGERADPSWQSGLSVAAVAAVVLAPLRGLFNAIGSTMEEGFMLVFPERVRRGDVPNVDFLHLYGPTSLDVLAGAFAVFGTSLRVERSVGLLQHLLVISALFLLVRPWGRAVAVTSSIAATLLLITPIGLTALAWNGGVGLGLFALIAALRARWSSRPDRWWFGAGVLGGLALGYRPDLVVALALGLGWLLLTAGRSWRRAIAGAVIGLVPMWVHLVVAGPSAAVRGMLLDPVFELRPGRELPRPPSWSQINGALQVIGENVAPNWPLPAPAASQQIYLWFWSLVVGTIALVVLAVALHRRQSTARTRVLVASSLFALGLLPQALQRPDTAHLAWVSMVVVPLVPPLLVEIVERQRPRWRHATTAAGIAVGLAVLLLAIVPFYSYRPYVFHVRQSLGLEEPGYPVERDGRIFRIGDTRTWRASTAVVADLDRWSVPGQSLLVGPVDLRQTAYSDAFFYHLFPDLEPATYFIEMDPGLANAPGSRLAGEVEAADWLLLTRFWSGWIEPNTSIVFGPDDANVAVETGFCLRGSYERDLVRLYERCEGGGAPGPYEGPYDPSVDYAVEVAVPIPPRSDGTYPPGSPAAP
jgi:hypothetical protein